MALVLGLAPISAIFAALQAQEVTRSVSEGVYTVDQASRGKAQFGLHCASCHGASLAGSDAVPPLAGKRFLYDWSGQPAGDLFDRIQTTMPQDSPGSLSRSVVADITAYIFSVNQFPAGTAALSSDAQVLEKISIEAVKPDKK
jgi:S-disulfanyl-L-cysteine oxidoreductase SoxD